MNWLSFIKPLVVCFILINVFFILFNNSKNFLSTNYWQTFDAQKKVFYDSQYKNKNFSSFIPDEVAYAYTGGALIRGENPVFNVPEAPPLGKYLIGLSAVLFNNPNIFITLIAGLSGLGMFYFVSRQVLGNSFVSLLPLAIMVIDPLYRNQYVYVPLFDLAHLLFLLTSLYFFNKGFISKHKTVRYFALASLFVGFFISTKFYSSGVPLIAAFLIVLVLNKNWHKLLTFFYTIWIPIAVLLATYLRVFAFNPSIREFFGIQKWIFVYWQGALILPFAAWELLLFNRWHTWWGGNAITSDNQWQLYWPIVTLLSFIAIIMYLLKKLPRKKAVEVLMAFTVTYGAFISAGTPTVRYFIIYLPILYILSIFLIQQFVYVYLEKRKIKRAEV